MSIDLITKMMSNLSISDDNNQQPSETQEISISGFVELALKKQAKIRQMRECPMKIELLNIRHYQFLLQKLLLIRGN
ncbi:hypothetical protein B9Z55_007672 [Caenorhabditis nigoni]|uniref:Uncharacterized protein n=1 Tax=Caenorhabditis nigoni TaxID=1611254 RepID=A0A2G5VAM6_9PELO|nr:hypothetical protein B9Z55_007672 [Caenorhabditis nigoni]